MRDISDLKDLPFLKRVINDLIDENHNKGSTAAVALTNKGKQKE